MKGLGLLHTSLENEEEAVPVEVEEEEVVEAGDLEEQESSDIDSALDVAEGDVADVVEKTEQVGDAAEELEEIQESIEAMKEELRAGREVPGYARAAVQSRATRVYSRLGIEAVDCASIENNAEWVDSLEASVISAAKRTAGAIAAGWKKLMGGIKNLWKTMTDASYRINKRATEIAKKVEAAEWDESAMADKAERAVDKHGKSVLLMAVDKNGKLAVPADLVAEYRKKEAIHLQTVKADGVFLDDLVKKLKDSSGKTSKKNAKVATGDDSDEKTPLEEHGGRALSFARALKISYYTHMTGKTPSKEKFWGIFEKDKELPVTDAPSVPGGQGVLLSLTNNRLAVFDGYNDQAASSLTSDLASFVTKKDNVLGLAKTVADLTAPGSRFNKATTVAVQSFYDDKAHALWSSMMTLVDEETPFLFKLFADYEEELRAQAYEAASIAHMGFFTTTAMYKGWLKSLKAANVVLGSLV